MATKLLAFIQQQLTTDANAEYRNIPPSGADKRRLEVARAQGVGSVAEGSHAGKNDPLGVGELRAGSLVAI